MSDLKIYALSTMWPPIFYTESKFWSYQFSCAFTPLCFLTSQRHPSALLFSPGLPAPLWPHIPPRPHDYTLEPSFTITLNLCPFAWNNQHSRSTPAMCLLCSVTIAENSTMGQTGITNLWFPTSDTLCELDDPFTHL